MSRNHPYIDKPAYQFWKHEPALQDGSAFDPVVRTSFKIAKEDAVVTAGSCFAQHVARNLAASGFNFLVTEKAHPIIPAKIAARFNYGLFSARYGNIYTTRQLKQLLQRAYGLMEPVEVAWCTEEGDLVDPFRPQIQKGGFASVEELRENRMVHFKALRSAIESMSVFVFTLGLTETWLDVRDGSVFPIAPGVVGGSFDGSLFVFQNFSIESVVADLQWSIDFIRERNPAARVLLTVSPVPLNATAVDRHVFVSTTYSKAVLRVAAELVCEQNPLCDYFPSYEIITSPYARGAYYGADCREVTEAGVKHVMSVFFRHYGDIGSETPVAQKPAAEDPTQTYLKTMEDVMEVLCDEEQIDNQ